MATYLAPTAAEIDANLRHAEPPFSAAHPANKGRAPNYGGHPNTYSGAAQGDTKGLAGVYFPSDPNYAAAMVDPFGRHVSYKPGNMYNKVWGNPAWPQNNVAYVKDTSGKWVETPRLTS